MGVYRRGDDWFIDYYVDGKRKRKKIGPDKRLAEIVLKKTKVAIAEHKHLDIEREETIKFEDFARDYMKLHVEQNNRSWKKGVSPNMKCLERYFSGKYLHEITPIAIENFKIERCKEVCPATVNRALALLKSIFNKAIAWDKFHGTNPVKPVKFYRENNSRTRYLEKEEIAKLIECCSDRLKPIVTVALNTGMRKSELLYLKWQDVDFNRGIIYVLRTKNGEIKELPMNEIVRSALLKVSKHIQSPYIYYNKEGKPLTNIRRSFCAALKKAGIADFRFHDLRHTFASQLVMSGIDLNTVRELMGHKTIKMTLRYSHLSPAHKKRAVDILAGQMDTIWSLKPTIELTQEKSFSTNLSAV